jgi:DNA polymerase-1
MSQPALAFDPEAFSTKAYFIPTYHPAFLLRGAQHYHEVVVADMQRAVRIARDGWAPTGTLYKILPNGGGNFSVDQAVNWLDENFRMKRAAAVDTECYGVGKRDALDQYTCKLHALGISFYPSDEALAFIADGSIGHEQTQRLFAACRAVMQAPDIPKIFFNASYDVEVLLRHGLGVAGPIYDNLVNHHVTDPEIDHDLGFVSQQFLDIEPWKVEYRSVERAGLGTLDRLLHYNAKDTLATQKLTPILMDRIVERGQTHIAELETRLMELAGRMGRVGIPINEERRIAIAEKLRTKRDSALYFIRSQLKWPEFEPRKPAHRKELLYERLKLPVRHYTEKRGEPATGVAAMVEHLDIDAVRALVKFDETAKRLATFVSKLPDLVDDNGRLHIRWKSYGTVGSRWSSENPNLQNWPHPLRAICMTKPGRTLVGADSKAIEYRVIVALSGCRKLIEIFADPTRDVHNEVCAEVFGPSFTNLVPKSPAWKNLRDIAKRVVYARNYRASPETICENLRNDPDTPAAVRSTLTPAFIAMIARNFDRHYPEIGEWCEREWDRANKLGYQDIIPLGRKRFHPVVPVEITKTSNNPIQFAAGDFQNLSLLAIDEILRERFPTAHVILNVHDQIVAECDEADAETIAQIIKEKMTHKIEGPAGHVMLEADPAISRDWQKV